MRDMHDQTYIGVSIAVRGATLLISVRAPAKTQKRSFILAAAHRKKNKIRLL